MYEKEQDYFIARVVNHLSPSADAGIPYEQFQKDDKEANSRITVRRTTVKIRDFFLGRILPACEKRGCRPFGFIRCALCDV